MKITLPKTKSSHLLLKRRFRKSSTPNYFSYKLWTVDQKFRAFFTDPQHKIQVWMERLFQIPTNRYLTMISNMRTPGAQVPLLLSTLQSRVMNTSEAADDGGVNPWILRGFWFYFMLLFFWLCEKSPSMTSSRPLGTSWRVVFRIKAYDSLWPTQLRGKTTNFKPFGTEFRG